MNLSMLSTLLSTLLSKKIFTLLTISLIAGNAHSVSKTTSHKKVSIHELKLKRYQLDKINSDLPITSVEIVGKNSLVFTGQENIWLLNNANGALKKISVPKKEASKSQKSSILTLKSKNSFLIQLNNNLLKLDIKPRIKLTRFPLKKNHEKILSLGNMNDKSLVITTEGVFELVENSKLRPLSNLPEIPPTAEFIEIAQNHIWLYSKHSIWKWDPISKKTVKIAKNIKTIEDIKFTNDRILVQTKYSLIALQENGAIDQTIPVSSTRKLIKFDIRDNHHAFLFDDKQIEIYDAKTSVVKYSKIPVGQVKSVDQLMFSKGKIVSVLDGNLKIFQLEGTWK
jgi:hypothetical protein